MCAILSDHKDFIVFSTSLARTGGLRSLFCREKVIRMLRGRWHRHITCCPFKPMNARLSFLCSDFGDWFLVGHFLVDSFDSLILSLLDFVEEVVLCLVKNRHGLPIGFIGSRVATTAFNSTLFFLVNFLFRALKLLLEVWLPRVRSKTLVHHNHHLISLCNF